MLDNLPEDIFYEICIKLGPEAFKFNLVSKTLNSKLFQIVSNSKQFQRICKHKTWKSITDLKRDIKFFSASEFVKTNSLEISGNPCSLLYFPKTQLYAFATTSKFQFYTFNSARQFIETEIQYTDIVLNACKSKNVSAENSCVVHLCPESGDLILRTKLDIPGIRYIMKAICTSNLVLVWIETDDNSVVIVGINTDHPNGKIIYEMPQPSIIGTSSLANFFKSTGGISCVIQQSTHDFTFGLNLLQTIFVANDLKIPPLISRNFKKETDETWKTLPFKESYNFEKSPKLVCNPTNNPDEFCTFHFPNTFGPHHTSINSIVMQTPNSIGEKYRPVLIANLKESGKDLETPILSLKITTGNEFICIAPQRKVYNAIYFSPKGHQISKPNLFQGFVADENLLAKLNGTSFIDVQVMDTHTIHKNDLLYTPDGIFTWFSSNNNTDNIVTVTNYSIKTL